MELLNTLIIDSGDDAKRSEFISLIQDNSYIVFVVLDKDEDSKALVEEADRIADDHQGRHSRRVAWIEDRSLLQSDCLAYLKSFKNGFEDGKYENVLGFTLSPVWHETKFILMKGDPADSVDVSYAYWKASLSERAVPEPAST